MNSEELIDKKKKNNEYSNVILNDVVLYNRHCRFTSNVRGLLCYSIRRVIRPCDCLGMIWPFFCLRRRRGLHFTGTESRSVGRLCQKRRFKRWHQRPRLKFYRAKLMLYATMNSSLTDNDLMISKWLIRKLNLEESSSWKRTLDKYFLFYLVDFLIPFGWTNSDSVVFVFICTGWIFAAFPWREILTDRSL